MKIYVSFTFEDLRDHRAAFKTVLRRMGHDVIGMERYVTEGTTPLERCLADVRSPDICVVIVAWKYGHVPKGAVCSRALESVQLLGHLQGDPA